MPDRITIEMNSAPVQEALNYLANTLEPGGMRGVLMEIGEYLVESTKQRFATSTAPDGTHWLPNSEATYLNYLSGASTGDQSARGRHFGRDGRLNARGSARATNKKPLVDTGELRDKIAYQVAGDTLFVGTNRFANLWSAGAAVHQFGSRNGKIPARPFLGLSNDDETTILDILRRNLDDALSGQ
ncbi:MAG: phage virion morphogenesis protein [Azonexus sp.]|jgi:phage gpG-like protein|nr:phage virion morphogenesis protein [Azonexus sp.]